MSTIEKQIQTTKVICINSNAMDQNILKYVLYLLKEKYEKKCDKIDGYILSIDKLLKLDNIINKDSCSIYFTATLLITVVKPEKGMELVFVPSMIISKGVFGKLAKYDSISFLIPDSHMKEWTFQDGIFAHRDHPEKKISKDTPVRVVIDDIKFNQTKYNCVCSLC